MFVTKQYRKKNIRQQISRIFAHIKNRYYISSMSNKFHTYKSILILKRPKQ